MPRLNIVTPMSQTTMWPVPTKLYHHSNIHSPQASKSVAVPSQGKTKLGSKRWSVQLAQFKLLPPNSTMEAKAGSSSTGLADGQQVQPAPHSTSVVSLDTQLVVPRPPYLSPGFYPSQWTNPGSQANVDLVKIINGASQTCRRRSINSTRQTWSSRIVPYSSKTLSLI